MISFCTGCCNRSEHIAATYEHNLDIGKDHEFILVNYGDKSGLDEYVKDKLMKYPNFTYYKTDAEYFHMSKSKNLSHRLATGDFLFCLDADTYISRNTIEESNKCLEMNYYLGSHYSQEMIYGLSKDVFYKLGGYDETFEGWGHEDWDLSIRCRNYGIKYYKPSPNVVSDIKHPQELKFIEYAPEYQNDQLDIKREILKKHKEEKITRVNLDGFAKHKVIKNFEEEFVI